MIETIQEPVATAIVTWRSTEEGGRESGPPTAPVYMPTSVFLLGGERETQPDWPQNADPTLSTMIERIETRSDGSWLCRIDFFVRELAEPYLKPGGQFLIMEGGKVVASAVFVEILPAGDLGQ